MSAQVAQALMSRGLSKPSLFEFQIPPAPNNDNFGVQANRYLSYYCKNVSLPGVSHDIMIVNGHERQGVVASQPYGVKYNKPLTITVIERSDYALYEQLTNWYKRTATNSYSLAGSQRMRYRDNYTCNIVLTKLELPTYHSNNKVWEVNPNRISTEPIRTRPMDFSKQPTDQGFRKVWVATFADSYISSIGDITYSTESRDSMVEYQLEFMYTSYDVEMANEFRPE